MNLTKLQVMFLAVAFTAITISGSGFYYFMHTGFLRLRPVEELNQLFLSQQIHSPPMSSESDQQAFLELMEQSGFPPDSVKTFQDVIRLQTWIGNQVGKVENYSGPEQGYALLKLGMEGIGLGCAPMSMILREALALHHISARTVLLYRTDFAVRDTHQIVEAFISGKWIAFDPTFNVTYQHDGEPLGVKEIQELINKPNNTSVSPLFHGTRKYPATLARYDRDWRPLFCNAFVKHPINLGCILCRLPIVRFWTGPVQYVFGDKTMILFAKEHNHLYFLFSVVLPIFTIMSILLSAALFFTKKKG